MVGSTSHNETSSRSHAILIFNVVSGKHKAKLQMVDLAGSERAAIDKMESNIRMKEGSNINKSLLALGNCINVLG
jgi:kinesin family member 18/19